MHSKVSSTRYPQDAYVSYGSQTWYDVGLIHSKEIMLLIFLAVANIRTIHTAGSGLESTCLVFAYGLDLYWTRVTPSRMFDVLKEDFDYWFIVGTLAVLVLVTIVSQRLAAIKMLRQAWH